MGCKKDLFGIGIYVAFSLIASLAIYLFARYPFLMGLRAFLGFAYIIFLPGWVVVRCFFDETDLIEKIALSFGLSIAVVIIGIMVANMVLGIPITLLSSVLVLFVIMALVIAFKVLQGQIRSCCSKVLGKKKVGSVREKKKR